MRLPALLPAGAFALALPSIVNSAVLPNHQSPLSSSHTIGHRIPTVHESAIMARRILSLTPIGTLSTVFPSELTSSTSDVPNSLSHPPASVASTAIGLMEYISDCPLSSSPSDDVGNPFLLAILLATPYQNVAAGSNISLSLRWTPLHTAHPEFAAARPRFSLTGYLEKVGEDELKKGGLVECYMRTHPDVFWLPGSGIHEAEWVRLVVKEVYWFGGFGDRAFIGWIPVETWRGVTRREIEQWRLHGEEGGEVEVTRE